MIRLAAALLCDAASIRENLLHVLGGGITTLTRPDFPGPLSCDLAVCFSVVPKKSDVTDYQVAVVASGPDGAQLFKFEAQMSVGADPAENPQTVPAVFGIANMGIPGPGRYRIEILVGEERLGAVEFAALLSDSADVAVLALDTAG